MSPGTIPCSPPAARHNTITPGTALLFTLRGNATRVKRWRNTDGAWLTTTYSYDDLGNIRSIKDPLGHATSFDYADSFANTSCPPPAGKSAQAYVSTVTNARSQRIKVTRYPCTAQVQAHRDENDLVNGLAGTTRTYDLMDRPLTITDVLGGQTSFSYPNATTVNQFKTITSALTDTGTAVHDGLGRAIQSQHVTPNGVVLADTTYDGLGRVDTVSNPYLSGSNHAADPTYGITQTLYDPLGRVIQTTKQDGSVSTVSYTGNCTTTTDEAGKQRKACSDGLGRLMEVDEPNPASPPTNAIGWVAVSGNDQSGNSNVTITVPNSGFETPVVGAGAFQYGPAGASWTFVGAGISGNGSGFTLANPAAPDGVQVAFLQMGASSSISQSLAGFQAGVSYTVTFKAAQRGSNNNGGQDFDVYLDSTLLGTFRPASSSYSTLSTAAFTTTAGSHTLKFQGRDSSGGDNTALIDAVAVTGTVVVGDTGTVTVSINGTPYTYNYGAGDTAATVAAGLTNAINAGSLASAVSTTNADVAVPNAGFETPVVGAGAFQYGPAGGSWTFVAGISGNGSGFTSGNPAAPEGVQVAYLQGASSSFSQTLSGFQAGVSYTVTFKAAQRGNFNQGGQDFDVYLDSTLLATFRPASSSYSTLSTPVFTTTAGSHTLTFQGRDSSGGDNTALIDAVRVTAASGNVINLTSVVTGSTTNYTLTTSSTHSGNFTEASFSASPSGATLTGGLDAGDLSTNAYVTLYSYDALGNLLRVDQKGSAPSDSSKWRTRLFTYNSLSQLLTANNPESGTITYNYDADGELLQKTSPAPNQTGTATQTVSYCYDELHRVDQARLPAHTYTPPACPITTPVVSYIYDSGANAKGHLTSMTDQAGTGEPTRMKFWEGWRRRPERSQGPTTGRSARTSPIEYNLDGSVKTCTIPAAKSSPTRRILPGAVSPQWTAPAPSTTSPAPAYWPDGSLTGFISGNSGTFAGITNAFSYNKRLQPVAMSATVAQLRRCSPSAMTSTSATAPAAVITATSGASPTTKTPRAARRSPMTALNRLISAQNAGTDCNVNVLGGKKKFWGNNYGYDAWGNLLEEDQDQVLVRRA